MHDWRGLLDSIRVSWKDRGKNTSRKNVNICCPYCRDDQGYHLGISLEKEAYYCFRAPQHSGGNFVSLLVRLGVGRNEAVRLLNEYRGERGAQAAAPPIPQAVQATAWTRFTLADAHEPTLDYIWRRGFAQPEAVAMRYDIRYAPVGKWVARMLMPILVDGSLTSWTGRAVKPSAELKYLTQESGRGGLVYAPRAARDTVFVCEGPIDALKLAVAGESLPISALALTGKQMSDARIYNIQQAVKGASRLLLCLDTDTSLADSLRMLPELRAHLRGVDIGTAKLPEGYKDAGAMPQAEARQWLERYCGGNRNAL